MLTVKIVAVELQYIAAIKHQEVLVICYVNHADICVRYETNLNYVQVFTHYLLASSSLI